jgi:hypothetical protein
MKASIVRYLARHDPSGQVRDSVGKLIPKTVVFFRGSIIGRLNRMTLFHERIKVYHIFMGVQSLNDDLPGDSRRQRSNGREDGSFRHFGRLRWQGVENEGMAQILDVEGIRCFDRSTQDREEEETNDTIMKKRMRQDTRQYYN